MRRPLEQNQNQQQDTQTNRIENFQDTAQALNQQRHVFTPELHVTDRTPPKRHDCQQFPMLSGSTSRKHLTTTTD